MADNEAIQNVADAINRVAEELEAMNNNNRCDFTGYTFADSMGLITMAMTKIAEAMEEANKRK